MRDQRPLILFLAFLVLLVLGIAFVFLPDGWNLLPLFCIALVLVVLSLHLKAIRYQRERQPSSGSPVIETAEDDNAYASAAHEQAPELARRLNRAFGPIVAGLIIDLVDFATFGPVGLALGLPIGWLAGYWMGTALGLSKRASVWCAVAAGIYCVMPGTEVIPLATIAGACVRFRQGGKQPRTNESQ